MSIHLEVITKTLKKWHRKKTSLFLRKYLRWKNNRVVLFYFIRLKRVIVYKQELINPRVRCKCHNRTGKATARHSHSALFHSVKWINPVLYYASTRGAMRGEMWWQTHPRGRIRILQLVMQCPYPLCLFFMPNCEFYLM